MLTITTRTNGTKVIATTTVDGKKKQQTRACEGKPTPADHGIAAGNLAHRLIPMDKQTHELRQGATATEHEDGSYTFTV